MLELLNEVLNRLKNLESKPFVKTGKVVSTNPEKATVRVEIRDIDQKVSYEMPVVYPRTVKDKTYYMPEIGEEVICVFVNETEGFVLGSVYHEENTPPTSSRTKFVILFEDGTLVEYDKSVHKLNLIVNGNIEITATTTHNGDITINGNLQVNGNITASGDIADLNGSRGSLSTLRETYNTHTHNGGPTPDQTV